MLQSIYKIISLIVFRLLRRFVEWPLPLVFGFMIGLILCALLSIGSPSVLPLFAAILKYGFLFPLGLPLDQDSINLGTDQTFKLFGIWYLTYLILAELLSAIASGFKINRSWPSRRITLAVLVIGYGLSATLLGLTADKNHGFAWWPTQIAVVLIIIAAISLMLSKSLATLESKLQHAFDHSLKS